MLRALLLGQRLLQSLGIRSHRWVFDGSMCRRQPRIRLFHTLLNRRKLARLQIRELLLPARFIG